jgi:hypothetical protein
MPFPCLSLIIYLHPIENTPFGVNEREMVDNCTLNIEY